MTNLSPARLRPSHLLAAVALAAALPLAACAAPGQQDDETAAPEPTDAATHEQAASTPRLAITYDGGVQVLDATTLELLEDIELPGFNRINPAGDERHLLVSTGSGFQVLDLGAWGEPHGDHAHYYSTDPALLDLTYTAEIPGHAVVHHGRTALFDDGTGQVTILDSAAIAEAEPEIREHTTTSAHHGVAVELGDGTLLVTEGTDESRSGALALDAEGQKIASSAECPGVHGETVTDDEKVVLGCEDGALIYHDGAFTKVASPDAFGRIGNLRSAPGSDIVLGDYNANPDGGPLTQVALIDTTSGEISLVDLGAEYTFRSLGRDDEGHALVLTTDGDVHVIDPESGAVETSIPVIEGWEVPEDWQQPRPTLTMLAGSAYVTDPANQRLLALDVATAEVWQETELDVVPNEIAGVTGDVAEGGHEHEGEHEDGDDHEGHDH
ncbi:zinc metallochaperone AztD [Pseudactinotalea suaedae]|uniref:zinc metallochaperone AztD n=1 Tax=Pseudactinotalea suaedae TaxID=1524924 RepID=UPI00188333B0|nr:zinc metallochaperone AztD [Pseudactinotalea suaedae]